MKALLFIVAVVGLAILINRAGVLRHDTPTDSPPAEQPEPAIAPTSTTQRPPGSAPSSPKLSTPNPATEAQLQAMRRYPALSTKNSPMNKAFLVAYNETKQTNPDLLTQSDWPLTLAARAASSLPPPPATPKPKPTRDEDLWDAPDGLVLTIIGRVLSVTPRGVLLTDASIGIPAMKDVVTYRNPLDGSKRYKKEPGISVVSSREPVFVYGVTGFVDGERYSGRVCPAPNYFYTAVSGAARAVKAYAISTELARNPPKTSE